VHCEGGVVDGKGYWLGKLYQRPLRSAYNFHFLLLSCYKQIASMVEKT
jgi:hypothetical protein